MACTPDEIEQTKRLATVYERATSPVMQAVERRVCGCNYGSNSWLSRKQADDIGARLGLSPGKRLLDLGAGSGWPAVYLVKTFGCDASLVDLPAVGLRIAKERAVDDGIADRVETFVADAADLPFAAGSFDAISHCDLLCCLVQKQAVLENCRRVIRSDGRMAFTVISISPGLSDADHRRAMSTSPEFVESAFDYKTLLQNTGWSNIASIDITPEYLQSCRLQIEADQDNRCQLSALIGREEFVERLNGWRDRLNTIQDGLVVRELYLASPCA